MKENIETFSSPFIEERLYLRRNETQITGSRIVLVPFYRGAVVFSGTRAKGFVLTLFSSPFIEERLYLNQI